MKHVLDTFVLMQLLDNWEHVYCMLLAITLLILLADVFCQYQA